MAKNLYFLLAEASRAGLNASLGATLKGRALRGNGSVLIRVPSVQIVQIVPNVLNGLNRLNVLNPTHRKLIP
jgi:hypothetical protein